MLNKLPRFQPEGRAVLGVRRVPTAGGGAVGRWVDAGPPPRPLLAVGPGQTTLPSMGKHPWRGTHAEGSTAPKDKGVPVGRWVCLWGCSPSLLARDLGATRKPICSQLLLCL